MKVLFVDVGQGSCQIILLGGGRAIVIDAGSYSETAHKILKLNRVAEIELLVASHSHQDHAGGIVRQPGRGKKGKKAQRRETCSTGILVDYAERVHQIGFVQDCGFFKSAFGRFIVEELKCGRLKENQLVRLERTQHFWPLWPPNADRHSKTVLACVSPTPGGSVLASAMNDINAACAIIELRHLDQRIAFAGDSAAVQWESLIEHRKKEGLEEPPSYRILTMPHHGGLMGNDIDSAVRFASETVKAEVVVVSVGTANAHDHPRPEIIAAMRDAGAHVICTQITSQCCNSLESLRPGVIGRLAMPGASSPVPNFKMKKAGTKQQRKRGCRKQSKNVACAGTIEARLTERGILVPSLAKHRLGVDSLINKGHSPLCRVAVVPIS